MDIYIEKGDWVTGIDIKDIKTVKFYDGKVLLLKAKINIISGGLLHICNLYFNNDLYIVLK
jgi:hypothetical protein